MNDPIRRRRPTMCLIAAAMMLVAAAPSARVMDPDRLSTAASDKAKTVMMNDPEAGRQIGDDLRKTIEPMPASRGRALGLARAYNIIGSAESRLHRSAEARSDLKTSIAYGRAAGDAVVTGKSILIMGSISEYEGDAGNALRGYQEAYRIFHSAGERRLEALTLQYLGGIYANGQDRERALRYIAMAQKVYHDDPVLVATNALYMGNIYFDMGRYADAIRQFRETEKGAILVKMNSMRMAALGLMSATYLKLGRIDDAHRSAQEIRKIRASGTQMTPGVAANLAAVKMADGDLVGAETLLGPIVAANEKPNTEQIGLYQAAYDVASGANDTAKALARLRVLHKLTTEAASVATNASNSLLTARFDFANQELRIARLRGQEEINRRQEMTREARRQHDLMIGGGIVATAMLALMATLIIIISRSRAKTRQHNVELSRALAEIDERARAEEMALRLAEQDPLTGLPNRRALNKTLYPQLKAARQENEDCAVLILDLDRFKPINDLHGHETGDEVLKGVAARMRKIAERYGAFALRLGGDEFAMAATVPAGSDLPLRIAAELIKEIGKPFRTDTRQFTVGASIGIAVHTRDGDTVEELLRAADIAMFEVKRAGKGDYRIYHPAMDERLRERADLEADLRQAIREKRIVAAFQPVHSFERKGIVAFEALARWTHPVRGQVEPDRFIPIAEDSRLIEQITQDVLRQACQAARAWPADIAVAVNLSPVMLRDPWLPQKLLGTLTSEGMAPGRLIIEITENALVNDVDIAAEIIDSLRNVGVRVSLDDFGKGYSSLGQLMNSALSFDGMKLDKSMIQGIGENVDPRIAGAVASLAQAMSMPITAEGVETQAEADLVEKLGFTYAQGWLFGRPMMADEARIAAWQGKTPGDEVWVDTADNAAIASLGSEPWKGIDETRDDPRDRRLCGKSRSS